MLCWWGWFFFFMQKTAYEMRISDWSSDVCSSDLEAGQELGAVAARGLVAEGEQCWHHGDAGVPLGQAVTVVGVERVDAAGAGQGSARWRHADRKSTRLNSSH